MSRESLVRAWKDEEFRLSLNEADRAMLPENPAGSLELSDAELDQVAAASGCGVIICGITIIFCGYSIICGGTFIV
jgi:mersacidin/lichenicidin family type 2 lantibiotic